VLPLAFAHGQGWRALGLTGAETLRLQNVADGVLKGEPIDVIAEDGDRQVRFQAYAQVLTHAERKLITEGGIPASVLNAFLTDTAAADTAHC
jgi:aconitate hydratase